MMSLPVPPNTMLLPVQTVAAAPATAAISETVTVWVNGMLVGELAERVRAGSVKFSVSWLRDRQ